MELQTCIFAVFLLILQGGFYVSSEEDSCRDLGPCPRAYKRYCFGSRYRLYMEMRCRKFCGFCKPNLPCEETIFGCCLDDKTPADGPNDKGCTMKLCYDASPGYCKRQAALNKCHPDDLVSRKRIKEKCPYSCGYCKHQAPREVCKDIGFGCCWDGTPALGPNERGCPPCLDYYPHSCNQWGEEGCKSGSWRIRSKFMERYCPITCGLCSECHDRAKDHLCELWKKAGLCEKFKSTMKRKCAKTCNLCGRYSKHAV